MPRPCLLPEAMEAQGHHGGYRHQGGSQAYAALQARRQPGMPLSIVFVGSLGQMLA